MPGDNSRIQGDGAPGGFPVWPVPGYNNAVTSPYGNREDPFTGKIRFHYGIDIGAPEGTPVVAVYGGKYGSTDGISKNYGNIVIIDHGNSISTRYAHLRDKPNFIVGVSITHLLQ